MARKLRRDAKAVAEIIALKAAPSSPEIEALNALIDEARRRADELELAAAGGIFL